MLARSLMQIADAVKTDRGNTAAAVQRDEVGKCNKTQPPGKAQWLRGAWSLLSVYATMVCRASLEVAL